MRIAIDAMGGDRAPQAPVAGAVRALARFEDVEIVLVGDPARLEEEIARHDGVDPSRLHLHDAPEKVSSDEDPVRAIRKSERVSARAAASLLKSGEVAGVVTMGNTGAAVAAATLYCRRLAGVRRLGIAVPFPRPGGATIVCDAGANPDARAQDLHQYAIMAAHYAHYALGIETPRVGILSIGEEEQKGNRLVHETWERFRAQPVHERLPMSGDDCFVGNVEPRELFTDRCDVAVCDGFVGNIALKAAEGMAEYLLGQLAPFLQDKAPELARPTLGHLAQRVDYQAYGGAPLLGVDGGYMIGHGRSGPLAFENGVRVLRSYVQERVGERIVEALEPDVEATEASS